MSTSFENFDPVTTDLFLGINLIEASAGTGKTYAIAMLVLRLVVEKNQDIKQILVVTFTKAATEELKERIRQRLVEARQAVKGDDNTVDDRLKQWLNNNEIDSNIILQRLNHALLDIDQAAIFTIHGFCQRTLAEYALESGQLFDSELSGDISSVKQACSDDFWRRNIYPRSALEVSLLTAQYQTPDKLLASIDFISQDLAVLPKYENLEQKLTEIKQLVKSHKKDIKSSLLALKKVLDEGKFKVGFKSNFEEAYQSITDWLNNNNAIAPEFSMFTLQGLMDGLNGNKFRKSKANPSTSEEQKQDYLSAIDFDNETFQQIDSAIKNISLFLRRSLLKSLNEDVSKRLQQQNILSFDDLISRLADALQAEKGEELCQQIRLRYQTALIDEFQDTDQKQWLIFSTLFYSTEHHLYLIGDPKQAIYKFRGADIHSYFAAKKQAEHKFSLGFNWRSHPQLVEGVNTLFSTTNPFLSEQLDFIPVKAALTEKQGFLAEKDQALPAIVLWQLEKNEKEFWTSGKATTEIIMGVVNEVVDLLTADFSIQTEDKKQIQPNDMAILVRTNRQAKQFQIALNDAGVIAVINSKESVFSSQEASDLYIALQAIAGVTDHTLLRQALMLDWFNFNGQQLHQTLNDERAMDDWLTRFLTYQYVWKEKGLMAMTQQFLGEENIFSHLSEKKQAERRITNLQHSIELLQQAAIDENLAINKTLDWLHDSIIQAEGLTSSSTDEQQLRLESDENAIKIITMHGSKGLEYPIVFCPFLWSRGDRLKKEKEKIKCYTDEEMIVDLGSDQFELHRQLALEEELAEDLRVFYVAVTRAKYRCYINWADVRTKDVANTSAMAHLLNFSEDDYSQQQKKLQRYGKNQPSAFEYRMLEIGQEMTKTWQAEVSGDNLSYRQKKRSLYSYWQMSSYTALSSFSIHDEPELPVDKVREDNDDDLKEDEKPELPRGAQTGNVIHDLLENISFKYLAKENDISLQRDRSCLRYGLKTDEPEQINLLLKKTVKTVLSFDDVCFSLKDLEEDQCLKEMPFYLAMKKMDVSSINYILKDCPAYQPLSEKVMCGYLTGFIDLICEYQGKYFVIDYKSNGLENYEQNTLTKAMREHNYGLQYWIYTLVLHQYLQLRLPNYNYEEHIGGVMYLFVRGMDESTENSGVYQAKPESKMIEQLAALFI